jgi:protein SCO1
MRKQSFLIAAAAVAAILFVTGASLLWLRFAAKPDPVAPTAGITPSVAVGGPFELVAHTGQGMTDRDFHGRYALLFFGFTFCPDLCPTELNTMALALAELGPLAEKVQPLFISIDPERDTPEILARYVRQFHPRLIGLTGSPAQVAAAARAFRVYYAKGQRNNDAYLMDHSGFLYLIGPEGNTVGLFRPGVAPEQLAAALRGHLR